LYAVAIDSWRVYPWSLGIYVELLADSLRTFTLSEDSRVPAGRRRLTTLARVDDEKDAAAP
jgi:hypothetical protein